MPWLSAARPTWTTRVWPRTRAKRSCARVTKLKKKAENDRMAALYRQHVLKEAAPEIASGLQIQGLKKSAPKPEPTVN